MLYISILNLNNYEFYQLSFAQLIANCICTIYQRKQLPINKKILETFLNEQYINQNLNDIQVLQNFCSEINLFNHHNKSSDYQLVLMPTDYLFPINAKYHINGDTFIKKSCCDLFATLDFEDANFITITSFIKQVKDQNDLSIKWFDAQELKDFINKFIYDESI